METNIKPYEGLEFTINSGYHYNIVYTVSSIFKKKLLDENSEVLVKVVSNTGGVVPGSPILLDDAEIAIYSGHWRLKKFKSLEE